MENKYLLVTVVERKISVEVHGSLKAAQDSVLKKAKKEYLKAGNSEESWAEIEECMAIEGAYEEDGFGLDSNSGWSNLDNSENVDWAIFVQPNDQTTGAIHYAP